MRRRAFMALLGGAAAGGMAAGLPLAFAQPDGRPRRVAVLMGAAPGRTGETYLATFLRRLDELGWRQNHNLRIETRWWRGGPPQMQPGIAELLAFAPDVIMVFSNLALAVLKPMAGSVPIVFVGVGDPVGDGFVASLGHPGGTVTGFSGTHGPIGGKWLEVLKETAPSMARVTAIVHPETPVHRAFWAAIEAAAPKFGVEATPGWVQDPADIETVIAACAAKDRCGIIVCPHAVTWANEDLIVALTLRHRLPAIFATATSVAAGGLVSYSHDFDDSFRKTADYVDRILRGAKPADLPVQQPTKFTLVLNLKTAKAIGLNVPSGLITLADEVIE